MSFFDRLKLKTQSSPEPDPSGVDRLERLAALAASRPGDWSIRNDLADALAQAGRVNEATQHLCAIGDQLASEGFLAKAQALYKKVVKLQPRNEGAAQRLAELTTARINQSAAKIPVLRIQSPAAAPAQDATTATAPETPAEEAAVAEALPPPTDVAEEAVEAVLPESVEAPENVETPDIAETGVSVEAAAHDVADAEEWTPQIELTSQVEPAPQSETVSMSMPEAAADSVPAMEEARPDAEPSTVEESVAAAEYEVSQGALERAMEVLRNCARAYPERIEPVAMLADLAERAGVEDVLTQAQARLCDLQWRNGDHQGARVTAEALANRYPDDARHRARLDFILSELPESVPQPPAPAPEDDWRPIDTDGEEQVAISAAETSVADNEPAEPIAALDQAATPESVTEPEETREELERAASEPSRRVTASRQLAHLDLAAGELVSALNWLEWAAGGMPTAEQEEELAYDMAMVLERAGEFDRALGVYQEIAAKAGSTYRDVAECISRLSVHAQ